MPSSGWKPRAAIAGGTRSWSSCGGSVSTTSSSPGRSRRFSGGELTRASLARALAARADLLLLDEPTNHLDIPTLEWLEQYLLELDAAVVLVAHDRWFLESVGTSVLELEAGRARFFSGPWHAWRKEHAARQVALGKQIEKQEAEIARMEQFVDRFRYKATKARQAQSRLKQIEKVKSKSVSRDPQDNRRMEFSFVQPERASRVVLKLVNGKIEVPGQDAARGSATCCSNGMSTSCWSGRTGPARRP